MASEGKNSARASSLPGSLAGRLPDPTGAEQTKCEGGGPEDRMRGFERSWTTTFLPLSQFFPGHHG
jgi:hypothetical protein